MTNNYLRHLPLLNLFDERERKPNIMNVNSYFVSLLLKLSKATTSTFSTTLVLLQAGTRSTSTRAIPSNVMLLQTPRAPSFLQEAKDSFFSQRVLPGDCPRQLSPAYGQGRTSSCCRPTFLQHSLTGLLPHGRLTTHRLSSLVRVRPALGPAPYTRRGRWKTWEPAATLV